MEFIPKAIAMIEDENSNQVSFPTIVLRCPGQQYEDTYKEQNLFFMLMHENKNLMCRKATLLSQKSGGK